MAAPIASYPVYSGGANTTTLTSPSFTPDNGELILVKLVSSDPTIAAGVPSGGSQTYTSVGISNPGGFSGGYVAMYKATVSGSPGSMTVSATIASAISHSMVVERWAAGSLVGATVIADCAGASTAPSANLTGTLAGSAASWVESDLLSTSPAGRAYLQSGTEDGIYDGSGSADSVHYFAYAAALAGSGTQAIGMSAPASQRWNIVGAEIQPPVTPSGSEPGWLPWPILQQIILAAQDAQMGNVSVSGSAAVSPETGNGALGLSGSAVATKVAVENGRGALGLSAAATAAKVSIDTGRSALGLSGRATVVKVAVQTGTASIGLHASAVALKKAPQTASAAIGLSATGTERKIAPQTGRAAVGLSGYGAALKKIAQTGRAMLGLTARVTTAVQSGTHRFMAFFR